MYSVSGGRDGKQKTRQKIKRIQSVFNGKLSKIRGGRAIVYVEGDHGMGSTFGDRAPCLTYSECHSRFDNGSELFVAINYLILSPKLGR